MIVHEESVVSSISKGIELISRGLLWIRSVSLDTEDCQGRYYEIRRTTSELRNRYSRVFHCIHSRILGTLQSSRKIVNAVGGKAEKVPKVSSKWTLTLDMKQLLS